MKYPILTLFSLLVLNSCKNANANTKALSDGIVVLNPDLNKLEKKYNKYSTFNLFDSDENLYSLIEPSTKEKGKAKILIPESDQFNYHFFNEYIKKNMKGVYESYLVRKNKIVFRDFHQFYK